MNRVSYKNLFQLVTDQIDKKIKFNTSSPFGEQLSTVSVSPITGDGRSDATTADLVTGIQNLLEQALPAWIISGLTVNATSPETNKITISSGKGAVGGFLYELSSSITITVPFDSVTELFYITLYKDNIYIEKTFSPHKLTIAKIVVPNPGTTSIVQDNKDESWNAYIVNFKEFKLYGHNDKFEEDTVELLRNNISPILADNLIGNIKLSEDLKITNTQGTLELNSNSLQLYDLNKNLLAKFNQNGTYFYDINGIEVARFTNIDARVGNIKVTKNSVQSGNFVSGSLGFRIKDDGDVEFNNIIARGVINALSGTIGGWTIVSNSIYATTTGTIKTSLNVGTGYSGVILDKDGLRGYDSILGQTFNLPTNGNAPSFASGIITSTTFEINTNAILRTSSTVGDGSANSAGILINNTGFYGCETNQLLQNANLKALINGNISLKGVINASSGIIGNTTISSDRLSGGLIEGSIIRSSIIETSSSTPRIRIDSNGLYYQSTTNIGKYGSSGSGSYGFKYGDGTNYGTGILAYLFNNNFPPLSIITQQNIADIRLYNRASAPASGTHAIGDLICVNGVLKICTSGGSPGTFVSVGSQT